MLRATVFSRLAYGSNSKFELFPFLLDRKLLALFFSGLNFLTLTSDLAGFNNFSAVERQLARE